MPQTKERKREYMREYMRKKRAKEKEQKAEKEIRSGNLNYGLKPVKDVFPSYPEWVKQSGNEGKTFKDWIQAKIDFSRENRVTEQEPFSEKGTNIFHEPEDDKIREKESLDRKKRMNDTFKNLFGERSE